MSKLSRFSPAELASAAALIGAAAALACAILTRDALADNGPAMNGPAVKAPTLSASTGNPFSLIALLENSLTDSGVQASGPSALESFNGVTVEAVTLPSVADPQETVRQ